MKRLTRVMIPKRDRIVLDVLRTLGGREVKFAQLRTGSGYSAAELQRSLDRLIGYGRVHFRLTDDRLETLWSLSQAGAR